MSLNARASVCVLVTYLVWAGIVVAALLNWARLAAAFANGTRIQEDFVSNLSVAVLGGFVGGFCNGILSFISDRRRQIIDTRSLIGYLLAPLVGGVLGVGVATFVQMLFGQPNSPEASIAIFYLAWVVGARQNTLMAPLTWLGARL